MLIILIITSMRVLGIILQATYWGCGAERRIDEGSCAWWWWGGQLGLEGAEWSGVGRKLWRGRAEEEKDSARRAGWGGRS